ncbi:MAG TPA: DUF4238 domain-containing protein [Candidatus Lokiarchaeia archaeon]|nr:DUF4238 domain-containing protein [Candidatus Lokiarchaeia archaeon]
MILIGWFDLKQHTNPYFFSKAWAIPGSGSGKSGRRDHQWYVLDKDSGTVEKHPIAPYCRIKDFYGEVDFLEEIDGRCAKIFEKLRGNGDSQGLIQLTEDDTKWLMKFIVIQDIRTNLKRMEIKSSISGLRDAIDNCEENQNDGMPYNWTDFDQEVKVQKYATTRRVLNDIKIEEMHNSIIKEILNEDDILVKYQTLCHFWIFTPPLREQPNTPPEYQSICTADHPMFRFEHEVNHSECTYSAGVSYRSRKFNLILPISTDRYLHFYKSDAPQHIDGDLRHPDPNADSSYGGNNVIAFLNGGMALAAEKYVFSRDKENLIWIQEKLENNAKLKNFGKDGKIVRADEEQLKRISEGQRGVVFDYLNESDPDKIKEGLKESIKKILF